MISSRKKKEEPVRNALMLYLGTYRHPGIWFRTVDIDMYEIYICYLCSPGLQDRGCIDVQAVDYLGTYVMYILSCRYNLLYRVIEQDTSLLPPFGPPAC